MNVDESITHIQKKIFYTGLIVNVKRIIHPCIFLVVFLLFTGCNQRIVIYNTGLKDYTNVFKNAFSNSGHIIIKPGLYHLTAPIYLQNNIIIEGEGEVILVKDTMYSHVFVNQKAINDYTDEWNTSITIMNLIIDVNNKGNQSDVAHPTANGNLSFKFLDNLNLENIKIINGDSHLCGVHLQSVSDAKIRNYFYDGDKDAFHINGGCEDIKIDGFDISSFDDAFGIMTDDYPRVQHNAQDIRNITIKNGISRKRVPQSGFFLRFLTGSSKDWAAGNKFNVGHTVNFGNHQYKKVNLLEQLSLDCPVHLRGDSLYSDGITWRYIGDGLNKTSNIYKISLSNVQLTDGRTIARTINADEYNYGEYPGTENTSILDGLYLDGLPFSIIKGKVGVWKLNQVKNYSFYLLTTLVVLLILFAIIVLTYFVKRKQLYNAK